VTWSNSVARNTNAQLNIPMIMIRLSDLILLVFARFFRVKENAVTNKMDARKFAIVICESGYLIDGIRLMPNASKYPIAIKRICFFIRGLPVM
jgi:hypothetical protein